MMLRMVHAVLVLWLCELTCLASVSKVSFGSSNVGDECSARNQCVLSEDVGTSTPGNHAMPSYKLAWDGVAATDVELLGVTNLRLRADREARNVPHAWLSGVTDVELLRFLRAKHGHESEAWDMLLSHVEWRSSEFGADSAFTRNFFNNSPLHHEVFWMGLNKENCPTLVVRTQIHDGIYYNEDPRVFTSFLVSVLEEGRRQYGVGIERPMCVLIDRAGTVYRNGKKKIEKFDMAVIPNLLELFRHMYSTFTANYPDLLHYAKIAPASWFFSMCYKITSRVMDAKSRARFQMLKESEIKEKLHSAFDPATLPPHLLGTSANYTSSIDIPFDVSSVAFPPKESKKGRKWGGAAAGHGSSTSSSA